MKYLAEPRADETRNTPTLPEIVQRGKLSGRRTPLMDYVGEVRPLRPEEIEAISLEEGA